MALWWHQAFLSTLVLVMAFHLLGAKPEPMAELLSIKRRNTFQWNFIWDSKVSIQEDAFEKIICIVFSILGRLKCVNWNCLTQAGCAMPKGTWLHHVNLAWSGWLKISHLLIQTERIQISTYVVVHFESSQFSSICFVYGGIQWGYLALNLEECYQTLCSVAKFTTHIAQTNWKCEYWKINFLPFKYFLPAPFFG